MKRLAMQLLGFTAGMAILVVLGCRDDLQVSSQAEEPQEKIHPIEKLQDGPEAEIGNAWSESSVLDVATPFSGVGAPMANDCCEKPGQAEECWTIDADNDKVTCSASNMSNCNPQGNGQSCNVAKGLCTCATDADCGVMDSDASDGYVGRTGRCVNGLCGPSYCNGYQICNCWGGCSWWDKDTTNTPNRDATVVGLYCCDGTYPDVDAVEIVTYFSANESCTPGGGSCSSDAECDDANDCTHDYCDVGVGCQHIAQTGQPCDADGLACTFDECDALGNCGPSPTVTTPCPPDSYGTPSALNTCTEDCVEDPSDSDSDGLLYSCYEPLAVPSDTAVKPNAPSCDYWTCVPFGATVIPSNTVVNCSAMDDSCNSFTCDPAGAKDNCDDVSFVPDSPCPSSNPSNLCLEGLCQDPDSDSVAECVDTVIAFGGTDTDDCNYFACDPADGLVKGYPDTDANGDPCDDTIACTGPDVCNNGFCQGPDVCSDGDCFISECDMVAGAGTCVDTDDPSGTLGECADTDGSLVCTLGQCDGSGGCAPQAITCSAGDDECNDPACHDSVSGGCTAFAANTGGACTTATVAPNCLAECVEYPHDVVTGAYKGVCEGGSAINDTCATAISLGDFDATSANVFGQFGSTLCATDRHYTNKLNCTDGLISSGNPMGWNSEDVVYSFTYIADGTSNIRYKVKVETALSTYDAAVYVSSTCSVSGTPSLVDSQICVNNGVGKPQEDSCEGATYDCSVVNGTLNATEVDASAVVVSDPAPALIGTPVTVYVYVDGSRDWMASKDAGEFYVSVEREVACPASPADWTIPYGGTVHTLIEPGVNDVPVEINGVDFPGVSPNTQVGAEGVASAILLPGDTRAASGNNYHPGGGFEWAGYDEMWRMDVQAATTFSTSLCDYGGWADLTAVPGGCPAGGVLYDGQCWYLSTNLNDNCTTVCTNAGAGTCNLTALQKADDFNTAGEPAYCQSVLAEIAGSAVALPTNAMAHVGLGCGYNSSGTPQIDDAAGTCAAAWAGSYKRVCPCGTGAGAGTPAFDPMLALFDCFGNVINTNDNAAKCGSGLPEIEPTSELNPLFTPYYLLVDGYFESGVMGNAQGNAYDLSVYYKPDNSVNCDPDSTEGTNIVRHGDSCASPPDYPDQPYFTNFFQQCALIVDSNGCPALPGQTPNFHWTGGLQPGEWQCTTGIYSYCTPITRVATVYFQTPDGLTTCTETFTHESPPGDYHGNFPSGIPVPLSIGVCTEFVGIAVRYQLPIGLTPTQIANCEANCAAAYQQVDY